MGIQYGIPYIRIRSNGQPATGMNTSVVLVDEDGREHYIPCKAIQWSLAGGNELAQAHLVVDLVEIDADVERFVLQPEEA